jgi:hypothetical protein
MDPNVMTEIHLDAVSLTLSQVGGIKNLHKRWHKMRVTIWNMPYNQLGEITAWIKSNNIPFTRHGQHFWFRHKQDMLYFKMKWRIDSERADYWTYTIGN